MSSSNSARKNLNFSVCIDFHEELSEAEISKIENEAVWRLSNAVRDLEFNGDITVKVIED